MQELYEQLIDGLPAEQRVRLAKRGSWRAYVECEAGGGVASLLLPGKRPYPDSVWRPDWAGRPLRDLARRITGEDPVERALGCAALTAWYNSRAHLETTPAVLYPPEVDEGNVFHVLAGHFQNRIVGTIGHFHGGETLRGMRELRVFEKEPRPGDYPESAEEELLPGCEAVVITGMALTNGTMPRLLELAKDAYVALSGPSVPIAGVWFSHGVNALFGTMVWDGAALRVLNEEDTHQTTWRHMGKTVWMP